MSRLATEQATIRQRTACARWIRYAFLDSRNKIAHGAYYVRKAVSPLGKRYVARPGLKSF